MTFAGDDCEPGAERPWSAEGGTSTGRRFNSGRNFTSAFFRQFVSQRQAWSIAGSPRVACPNAKQPRESQVSGFLRNFVVRRLRIETGKRFQAVTLWNTSVRQTAEVAQMGSANR